MPESSIAYLTLKAAHKLYAKAPSALQSEEFEQVQNMARQQQQLEVRMLSTPEAFGVMVPSPTLKTAMQEVRGRYPSESEFTDDLLKNDMDEAIFEKALEQELKAKAILTKVGTQTVTVSEIDVELYYLYHPDQFRRPETRVARHILVTINEAIPENTRIIAHQRMTEILQRIIREPVRFEEQALKHSECPTALDGGKLGELPRGKLFPILDSALFALKTGQISSILESEIGLHILRCDAISETAILNFEQARDHIRKRLEKNRRQARQKEWIKQLLA